MDDSTKTDKLIDFLVGEIAKSSYLSTPSQFNDWDTKFQEGRLSAFNDMIDVLMKEEEL